MDKPVFKIDYVVLRPADQVGEAVQYLTQECTKCKAGVMHIHPTDEVWGEEEFPNGEFFQDPPKYTGILDAFRDRS